MHLLFDTALMAPVRGWLARAEHLLDSAESTPAHAWLAVVRSYERMLSGDRSTAMSWARRAIEVGSTCDPAATAIGRVAQARLSILDGEVERGLALLDEAGVALVAGDLDPLSTGVVYCELVCALQGLAQYDLAEEWTEAMERWCHTNAIGSLQGRCRVHRAEIMRLRGRCREAEVEALRACEELRPYLRRELGWPLSELGQIRLRTGDLTGAENALVAAHRAGWDAQPGLAQLLLAQGDVAGAAASIRDAIERPTLVPSKEFPPSSELRRAPLLAAQVEIAIADGDFESAEAAADELAAIAARFHSKALIASAAHSRAQLRLALGDAGGAERLFTEAAGLWSEVGAPYEAALARIGLGEACRAGGNQRRAELEESAARAIIDEIRTPPATGATADTTLEPAPKRCDAANAIQRIGDDWSVTFEGRTVQVRDRKGMHHLARLLTHPGREFHVLDLVAADQGNPLPSDGDAAGAHLAFGDAGEMLDASARSAYRRRLAEIDDDVEAARASGDDEREAQADADATFCCASSRVPSDSVVAVAELDRPPSAPDPVSRARSARRWPASSSTTRSSASISSAPSERAPTAPTSQTPVCPPVGRAAEGRQPVGRWRARNATVCSQADAAAASFQNMSDSWLSKAWPAGSTFKLMPSLPAIAASTASTCSPGM